MVLDKGYLNVWLCSIAFMLIFTAYRVDIKTLLEGVKRDYPDFHADGYICMALTYLFFGLSNLFIPSVISISGPRVTMIIGCFCFVGYLSCLVNPIEILVYAASPFFGVAAALLWTGQGNYFVLNTPEEKMERNSGIFWAMFQSSFLIGNTTIYFIFTGHEYIDTELRLLVMPVMVGISICGLLVLIFLPKSVRRDAISSDAEDKPSPLEVLKRAGRLLISKHMLILCVAFLYGGLQLAFYSGVYGPIVGFTLQMKDSKGLVGITGIALGLGEVVGGTIFGILGSYTSRIGRSTIFIFGCVLHLITFSLIFINFPNNAPFKDTRDKAIIKSSRIITVGCGFTLGLADACFFTQFYAAIGSNYPNNSASAFAIFKIFQNIGTCTGFFYSTRLILYGNLAVLTGFALIGTVCFIISEKIKVNEDEAVKDKKKSKNEEPSTSTL